MPKAYLRLLKKFRLRPIQDGLELAEATALADQLFDRPKLLPEEEQYLDVLCDLIEAYEDEHYAIADVGAAAMLRFLIDQRGVTQQTAAQESGVANSTITALIKGRRQMTRKQIESFSRYFGVEPAVFLPSDGGAQAPISPTGARGERRRTRR
jgi:HTH-type transcriptional regulator / antitoxin HigA